MIKDSYTDFTTVYTVSKNTQIAGDVLEQLDAVTMSEVAIFIQPKETQLKFSEELSNTVVRLGGLHTALSFLFLLGNKFRSYASALGSISIYGFMIFSTLSIFIDF